MVCNTYLVVTLPTTLLVYVLYFEGNWKNGFSTLCDYPLPWLRPPLSLACFDTTSQHTPPQLTPIPPAKRPTFPHRSLGEGSECIPFAPNTPTSSRWCSYLGCWLANQVYQASSAWTNPGRGKRCASDCYPVGNKCPSCWSPDPSRSLVNHHWGFQHIALRPWCPRCEQSDPSP